LERLGEIADAANDIFVAVDAERDNGNEAEGKPGIAFYNPGRVIATIMTLA